MTERFDQPRLGPAHLVAHVLAPLAAGAGIYLAWRSPEHRLFGWAGALGLSDAIAALRHLGGSARAVIPEWLLFSLPDGLWAYAASSAIAATRPASSRLRWAAWLLAPPALGAGWELGQLALLLPGTFDPLDLMAYAIAAVLALSLHARHAPPSNALRAEGGRPRAARPWAALAMLAAMTLLLTGTSKAPVAAPADAAAGIGGAGVVPAPSGPPPPVLSEDLPAPWDGMGLPNGANEIDAIRFVHRTGSVRMIEDQYVRSLTASGWTVVQRSSSGADAAVMLSRAGDQLALLVRSENGAVLVSVSRIGPGGDAGLPAQPEPSAAPVPDAGAPTRKR